MIRLVDTIEFEPYNLVTDFMLAQIFLSIDRKLQCLGNFLQNRLIGLPLSGPIPRSLKVVGGAGLTPSRSKKPIRS
ncbi:hypothetical protein K1719_023891 [Acacia pycnantha]|nr:hypothetical protein K1719_023891 [Acacia pycnantha]